MRLLSRRRAPSCSPPKLLCVGLVILGAANTWTISTVGDPRAEMFRCIAAAFALRFVLMLLVFIPRHVPWWEAVCTGVGMALVPSWFLSLCVRPRCHLSLWLDAPALSVHIIGSILTSLSEWQRWRWKQLPQNAGRLYVGGLFGIAKHINYSGEILTFFGWAALTRRLSALAVPLFFALALSLAYVPDLQRHIRRRYANDANMSRWQTMGDIVPRDRPVTLATVALLCTGSCCACIL